MSTTFSQITLPAARAGGCSLRPARNCDNAPTGGGSVGFGNGNVRLSKLIGAKVKSNDGKDIGKLEDVLVDQQTGKPAFAILGQGGALGLGEKRRPVPWQELQISSDKPVTLNMDKQKFSSGPTTIPESERICPRGGCRLQPQAGISPAHPTGPTTPLFSGTSHLREKRRHSRVSI